MGFESRMEGSWMTYRSGFYLHTARSTGVFWVVYSIDMMLHDDIVAVGTYTDVENTVQAAYHTYVTFVGFTYEIILIECDCIINSSFFGFLFLCICYVCIDVDVFVPHQFFAEPEYPKKATSLPMFTV